MKFRDKAPGVLEPGVDTEARAALVNLSALEEEDGDLAQVKVDEMPGNKEHECQYKKTPVLAAAYLVSWVTYEPKFLPTMQCQVGLYFLSNSFLM